MAVKQLYEAASARMTMSATLKAITPPLLAMLIPTVPIFLYVRIIGMSHSGEWMEQLVIGVAISIVLVWYAIALWYLGVVPFLRGRPSLYDVMEDQVRVFYGDGSTISIDFAEIQGMRYVGAQSKRLRGFWEKVFDPFGKMMSDHNVSLGIWVKEVVLNILPPYAFRFGSGPCRCAFPGGPAVVT